MQGLLVCGYVGVQGMLGYRTCYIQCEAYLEVGYTQTCLAVVPVGLWGILRCGNVGLWYMEGCGACWAMRHT